MTYDLPPCAASLSSILLHRYVIGLSLFSLSHECISTRIWTTVKASKNSRGVPITCVQYTTADRTPEGAGATQEAYGEVGGIGQFNVDDAPI